MKNFFTVLCVLLFASTVALAGPDHEEGEKYGMEVPGKTVFAHDFSNGSKLSISLGGDDNKDDINSYGIGLKAALGFVNIMPRVVFTTDRSLTLNRNNDTRESTEYTLALNGEKKILAFEGEFAYQNVDYSGIAGKKNVDIFGVYGNIQANLDAGKIGLLFAYGGRESDNEPEPDFGNDFDGAIFLGEAVPAFRNAGILRLAGSPHQAIAGVTLAQVYAKLAIGDKLHVKPSLTYFADNLKNLSADEYEVNLSAGYKITDMMTYKAAVAFSKIDAKESLIDADNIDGMSFFQKLVLDF